MSTPTTAVFQTLGMIEQGDNAKPFDEPLRLSGENDPGEGIDKSPGEEHQSEVKTDSIRRVESLAARVDTGGFSTDNLMAAYKGKEDELVRRLEKMKEWETKARVRSLVKSARPGRSAEELLAKFKGREDELMEKLEKLEECGGNEAAPVQGVSLFDDSPTIGDVAARRGKPYLPSSQKGSCGVGHVIGFALLLSFVSLLAVVFLSGNRGNNTAGIAASPLEGIDLSAYGYPHTEHTNDAPGWVSWPADADYRLGKTFLLFSGNDGVTSPEECAARCGVEDAPMGSWSVRYRACWCGYAKPSAFCREPCVDGRTVDFARFPLGRLGYCERSVCEEGWYHGDDFCDDDVGFDADACKAKKAAIAKSPTDSHADNSAIVIDASALQTAMKSHPDSKTGGEEDLSVENDERISYVRFDLSSVWKEEDAEVTSVWLNLYLVTQSKDESADTIHVDVLPNGGGWEHGSVSWNDPLSSEGSFRVNSFSVTPLGSKDGKKRLYEVDVTSAISSDDKWITFRLTTKSARRWYFASEGWWEDTYSPKLLVTVATSEPAKSPVALAPTVGSNGAEKSAIIIEASALQTAMKSHPDSKTGGKGDLSVENKERISYVRFDLSSVWKEEDAEVTSAWLNLYLVTQSKDESADTIHVDVLPNGGGWEHGSVSWNDPLSLEGSFRVNSFSVTPLESKDEKNRLYEVDVTSAIPSGDKWITFRLTTKSARRWYFASEGWWGGAYSPKLLVTAATPEPAISPVALAPAVTPDSAGRSTIFIKPSALQTAMKSHPDAKYGGKQDLSVQNDKRISYVRFDLSSVLQEDDVVASARLNLYLVTYSKSTSADTIVVDMLPNGGGWNHGSVSWNEPLTLEGSFTVNSFSVTPLESKDDITRLYEVDVTSAIRPGDEWVTFRLTTKSDRRWYFASDGWDGVSSPELLVTLAPPMPMKDLLTGPMSPIISPVAPSTGPTPDTITPFPSPEGPLLHETDNLANSILIEPSAVQTVMKIHPNATWGGIKELALKKDNAASYVRFDLSSVLGEDAVVKSATLNLYSVTQCDDESGVAVAVDALPNVGGWTHGSASWKNPLDSEGSISVNTFSVVPSSHDSFKGQWYKVDVTSAVNPDDEWITFMLTSESDTELNLASEEWNEGEAMPGLLVTLAAPEPTKEPTASPVSPTMSPIVPTISPMVSSMSPMETTKSPVSTAEEAVAPATSPVAPPLAGMDNSTRFVRIKPSAVQTAMKGHPDAKWGGKEELTVKKDERISYVRFGLSSISGYNVLVTMATLRLFSVTHSDAMSPIVVAVDALPDGGDWIHGSISWNDPPETDGWYNLNSFTTFPRSGGTAVQYHEVNVTSAVSPWDDSITFRFSSDSTHLVGIASKDWKEGDNVPELLVTLSTT